MELNASDERGIAVVRNKIKAFAQVSVSSSTADSDIPPYKLIVLDEADSMTNDAQSALRRTMETYSRATRFCIICNYISRIIPPISSRCAKFRFKPVPQEAMVGRLRQIAQDEGVTMLQPALDELMPQSDGDMRRAIQMLQSLQRLGAEEINEEAVLEISGSLPKSQVASIFSVIREKNFSNCMQKVEELLLDGFPPSQIISQMLDYIVDTTEFGEGAKSKMAICISETDKMLVDGAGDYLQLVNVFATCSRAVNAR